MASRPSESSFGDGLNVGRLVVPVGLKNGNVLQLQQHFGMLLKRLARHLVGVLRRHGQHDSSLAQVQASRCTARCASPVASPLRDLDALQPIVSDHSAPYRVVEVENQNFSALAANGRNRPSNMIGVERNELVGEGELGHVP